MILQALIAYAEREGLAGDPAFEMGDVHWVVPVGLDGKLTGPPIPMHEDPSAKKPRPKRMLRPFTSPNELSVGGRSHFLCDNLKRIGFLADKKEESEGAIRCNAYFLELLSDAAAAIPGLAADLRAVIGLLSDPLECETLQSQLRASKAKPTESVTFQVAGKLLIQDPLVKAFWRNRRSRAQASKTPRPPGLCIATGELTETVNTTEKIKGVPGGLGQGTNLIAFDKDAFCSYGLEQAQNAAVSVPAELKIRSALNSLIEKSRRQGLVFNSAIHLHWTREAVETDEIDLLTQAEPEAISDLLQSVAAGHELYHLEANFYYVLTLSGNGARIVVRDWFQSSVPEVRENIAHWFLDLSVVELDGQQVRHDFKFAALLYAMVRKEMDELPPALSSQLFNCALKGRGQAVPEAILAACLHRQRLPQESPDPRDPTGRLKVHRMALIKLILCRLNPFNAKNMTENLNMECNDPAYLCGRLFAVFDRIQHAALGGVNAGVVERFYASASVTPNLVMGRLFRNAQNHISKAGGLGQFYEKELESISSRLGSSFPETLSLEQQGRFALGYYHQRADFNRRWAERKLEKAKEEPAQLTLLNT